MPKKDLTPRVTDMMKQMQGMMAMNPAWLGQVEQFWRAQDGVLDEAEAYSSAWYARRHAAVRSALQILREMNGRSADPAAGLQAISEWQRHSVERMTEDMQHFLSLCAHCAGRIASAESELAEDILTETEKRTKAITQTRHATPV